MVDGRDQAHSTLELASQQPRNQAGPWKPLPFDPGKQVALDPGKQYVEESGEIEVATKEDSNQHETNVQPVLAQRLSARRRKIGFGILGLIIGLTILGAVLGGVLGSRQKSSAEVSSNSPSNSSVPYPSPSITPAQRNIAAVSLASNSTNATRVYFQDDVGQIIEASHSELDSTWGIKKTGAGGKNGSAIAAAVSRPSLPLEISIFYLDVNNLIHDSTYTASTGSWTAGTLSDHKYTAMSNSSLTAMYNWCRLCANTTIIAFQDENGFVQIGNHTSNGWTLNQLGQVLAPESGTGLALQPFYRVGEADQINLYYQKSVLNMALASWQSNLRNGDGWAYNEQIYDSIPSGSPIAAASSYSNVSSGFESWIEVLSLSSTGIAVDTWSGPVNDWLIHHAHPSAMANSTNNMRSYESIAVTAIGNAFAVVKQDGQTDVIENWQVSDDTINWSLIGNVDLDGIWG
ncbi:hypothetical protein MMC07_003786 [Pseudocyphellaria aurata]|nr:hypothetical protein [Pseudocyphellaria aurata]